MVAIEKQKHQEKDSELMALNTMQILDPNGHTKTSEQVMPIDAVLAAYKNMLTARTLDEKMIALQRQGRMGTYVSSSGQEASQVGSVLGLKEKDWLFPMYRDLAMVLGRGVPLESIVNKLFGNGEDEAKGRDLPNTFGWKEFRIFTLAAPIASQVQLAVGFAMAARYRNDDIVTLTSFGDGATSSGEFHAGMNFAGVFRAPVVFVCENNQYAISVPVSRQTASETIAIKAIAYGFDGNRVDGNDLFAVFKATKDAAEKARRGEGPTLIECVTYRMGAHSTADDWKRYRTVEEVDEWKRKDPLVRVKLFLTDRGALNESEDSELRKLTESVINQVVAKGEKLPPPDVHSMFEDVFARVPEAYEQDFRELEETEK
jgi:pyruvate dehydrogenase E1 component alpha subunit